MLFDVTRHRCTIIIHTDLPGGLAINAASVIALSMGHSTENLVGPDMISQDKKNYPGVIYAPLPVLQATGEYLHKIYGQTCNDTDIYTMPFSALAQSCKTYDEYEKRIASLDSNNIELVALGLIGPRKKIVALTGNLPLFK